MSFEDLDEILKMSPVVELKEEAEDQVLKADFCGHLQLVSVSEGIQVTGNNATEINRSDKPKTVNGKLTVLTEAEKKKLLRMKIKNENPAMWCAMKEKEAMRKRELREQRKKIMHEMQSAMDAMCLLPDSSECSDEQMYLEALKERYPDIWNQLINAIPEMEKLQENKRTKTRRYSVPKPPKMYKNVIEAQKKRLYRQRLKEERPEMYERQKAREAFAYQRQKAKWAFEKSLLQNLAMENVESSSRVLHQQHSEDPSRQFSVGEKMFEYSPYNLPTIKSECNLMQSDDVYDCGVLQKEITLSSSSTTIASNSCHHSAVVSDTSTPCHNPIIVNITSAPRHNSIAVSDTLTPSHNSVVVNDTSTPSHNSVVVSDTSTCENPTVVSNASSPCQNAIVVSGASTHENPVVDRTFKNEAFPSCDNECVSKDYISNDHPVQLSPAEQKRLYRMKLKTENPALWSAMKEKEAMRVRKYKERRKKVMQEMQSASEVTSLMMQFSGDEKTSDVVPNHPPIIESESTPMHCRLDHAYVCGALQEEITPTSSSNSFTPTLNPVVVSDTSTRQIPMAVSDTSTHQIPMAVSDTSTCQNPVVVNDISSPCQDPVVVNENSKNLAIPNCDNEYLMKNSSAYDYPVFLTQAEQKKLYRMKIKRENPALWRSMKEKDAMRKRELREQRRKIMHEMQPPLQSTSQHPYSTRYSGQLEALTERQFSVEEKISDYPLNNPFIINLENMSIHSENDHSCRILQKEVEPPSSSTTFSSTPCQSPVVVSDTSTTPCQNSTVVSDTSTPCQSPVVISVTSTPCQTPIVVSDASTPCQSPVVVSDNSKNEASPNCDNEYLPKNYTANDEPVRLTLAEQKKLYRMRLKKENPARWSAIKEKDAMRKRELRELRRKMMYDKQDPLQATSPNFFYHSYQRQFLAEEKIYDFQIGNPPAISSECMPLHSEGDPSYGCDVSTKELAPSTSFTPRPSHNPSVASDCSENKTFPTCDQEHMTADYPSETSTDILPDIYSSEPRNPTTPTELSSTQSNVLWYWNDVKTEPIPEDIYFQDPEQLRLRKIVRERKSLLERRRQNRLKMDPEKRVKFLASERERVRNYKLKKQGELKAKRKRRKKMDDDDKAWCRSLSPTVLEV